MDGSNQLLHPDPKHAEGVRPNPARTSSNSLIAERLREAADILEGQNANPFRVSAYRRAADTLQTLTEDVSTLLERDGIAGLDALPAIGPSLASAIAQMARSERWVQLDRLRASLTPEKLFQTIPGIGPILARQICDHLDVDSLEDLEIAARDGRLEAVSGIGRRRAAMIAAALNHSLARVRPIRRRGQVEPAARLLLEVDGEYRRAAARGDLPKISPRRFNPTGEAWLPILHLERGGWRFTAVFSNTARAHELGRTHDWVVIYFERDRGPEGQRTVVTETHGSLAGRRVVRGREVECGTLSAISVSHSGR